MYFFFFFSSRRRHTRYWRDWSSDVCSSDLHHRGQSANGLRHACRTRGQRLSRETPHATHLPLPSLVSGVTFLSCIIQRAGGIHFCFSRNVIPHHSMDIRLLCRHSRSFGAQSIAPADSREREIGRASCRERV